MNESGLLAHLRDHFHVPPENLATETLNYILVSSERARNGWQNLLRQIEPEIPEITHFQTQVRNQEDNSIPDLAGYSKTSRLSFLGEVKFDAGLTINQPVTYIRQLEKSEKNTVLLFIVPGRRVQMVWNEIRWRCRNEGVELSDDRRVTPDITAARAGAVSLAIVSWGEVLNRLENVVTGDKDARALWDIRQLRAMCDVQECTAFLPIEVHELASRIGRRLVELRDLNYEITSDVLRADETAIALANVTSTGDWTGRYMMSKGGWWCMLQLNWAMWATERSTPVWFIINDSRVHGYEPLAEALLPLFTDDPPRAIRRSGIYFVPIYVKPRASRDEVRNDIAEQVRSIVALMEKAPAPSRE